MIRRIIFDLLLFLLPFALYGAYWRLSPSPNSRSTNPPWSYLLISGLMLVAASFLFWGVTEGSGERGIYVPAHLENGRVVPGHVVTAPAK